MEGNVVVETWAVGSSLPIGLPFPQPAGTYTFTAVYHGNTMFLPSTSAPLLVTVRKIPHRHDSFIGTGRDGRSPGSIHLGYYRIRFGCCGWDDAVVGRKHVTGDMGLRNGGGGGTDHAFVAARAGGAFDHGGL